MQDDCFEYRPSYRQFRRDDRIAARRSGAPAFDVPRGVTVGEVGNLYRRYVDTYGYSGTFHKLHDDYGVAIISEHGEIEWFPVQDVLMQTRVRDTK